MIEVSKGVFLEVNEIEALYDDINVMRDRVLIYLKARIDEINTVN